MATLQFDLVGNVKLNTQQAQQQMAAFVGNNNMPRMAENNNLPLMSQLNSQSTENLNESSDYLDESFRSLKDVMRSVLENFKALNVTLDETEQKYQNQKNRTTTTKTQSAGPTNETSLTVQNIRGVQGVVGATDSITRQLSGGNVGGAISSGFSGLSQVFSNRAEAQKLQGNTDAMNSAMKAAAGLALVGGVIGLTNSLSNTYTDSLDENDSLLRMYGMNYGSAKENDKLSYDLRKRAVSAANGTGLSTSEYIGILNNLNASGVNNSYGNTTNLATQIGMWSHYTGADTSTLTNFAGLVERFGGNGANALSKAYQIADTQGLNKGQFGEFLSGLQSVIENGIAKGYVKSSDDIVDKLNYFTQTSTNSALWEGKYGFQRLNQMQNAGSNVLSLSNTSDMLMYRAAKEISGKSDVDLYRYIQSGEATSNPEVVAKFLSYVQNTYTEKLDQLQAIKSVFNDDELAYDLLYGKHDIASIKENMNKKKAETKPEMATESTSIQAGKNEVSEGIIALGKQVAKPEKIIGDLAKYLSISPESGETNLSNITGVKEDGGTDFILDYFIDDYGKQDNYNKLALKDRYKKATGKKLNKKMSEEEAEKEISAYFGAEQQLMQGIATLKASGIDESKIKPIFNDIANAQVSGSNANNYIFSPEKIELILQAINKLVENSEKPVTISYSK